MPTHLICEDSALWLRFKKAVLEYQSGRIRILQQDVFPYVSGVCPFHMKVDAHERFLKHVYCYRRMHVYVDQEMLSCIHKLGLLEPAKTIGNNGSAIGECFICSHFIFDL